MRQRLLPPITRLEADFSSSDLRAIPRGTHFETDLGHPSGQKAVSWGHILMKRLQKASPEAILGGFKASGS